MCTRPICRQLQLAGTMVIPTGGYGNSWWKAEISIEVLRLFRCDLVMEEKLNFFIYVVRDRGE